LIACSSNSSRTNHDTTIVDYTIKEGEPLPSKDWHCYDTDDDKICIPEAWGIVNQNKFLLMSDLNHVAPGSYFVVVKSHKANNNAIKYLKDLYSELKNDTTGKLTGWRALKTTYANKESFYSEYNISIGSVPYVVFSTVFENGNDLFDVSLKMSAAKAAAYQEEYKNVLFNFYHKGKQVFTVKDKIVGVKFIDLSML